MTPLYGTGADGEADLAAALALAGRHGLSYCDGLYLELACRRGAVLATLDDRLLAAARAEGVAERG
ncbi:MAG TPA: type II toxin-antitoxin system VapC family toxin [Amaricoccus sp.]|nr:type II toxin-antitoxin system VapC family toxin [Amaricoccus sp.]